MEFSPSPNHIHRLSEEHAAIQVVAAPQPVDLSHEGPIPLGYFQPDKKKGEDHLPEATVFFTVQNDTYSCYAEVSPPLTDAQLAFDFLGSWLEDRKLGEKGSNSIAVRLPDVAYALVISAASKPASESLGSEQWSIFPQTLESLKNGSTAHACFPYADEPELTGRQMDSVVINVGRVLAYTLNYFRTGKPLQESLHIALPGLFIKDEAPQPDSEDQPEDPYAGFPSFDDFGGIEEPIAKLKAIAEEARIPADLWKRYGLQRPGGILLVGPSGVGKTELSKAFAREINAEFAPIRSTDVLDKYIGESAKQLRKIFETAAQSKGLVLCFFDECDGLFGKNVGGDSGVGASLKAELKNVLNNPQLYPNVILMGAANSADSFDPALFQAGRLEVIAIPKPDVRALTNIFEKLLHSAPTRRHFDVLSEDHVPRKEMDMNRLATLLGEGSTGADVRAVVNDLLHEKMRQEFRTGAEPARIGQLAVERAIGTFRLRPSGA